MINVHEQNLKFLRAIERYYPSWLEANESMNLERDSFKIRNKIVNSLSHRCCYDAMRVCVEGNDFNSFVTAYRIFSVSQEEISDIKKLYDLLQIGINLVVFRKLYIDEPTRVIHVFIKKLQTQS